MPNACSANLVEIILQAAVMNSLTYKTKELKTIAELVFSCIINKLTFLLV